MDKKENWGGEECDQVREQQRVCGRFSEQIENDKEDNVRAE